MKHHKVPQVVTGRADYLPRRMDFFPGGRGQRHGSIKRRSCGKTQSKDDQVKNLKNWLEERGLPVETETRSAHLNMQTMIRATGGRFV